VHDKTENFTKDYTLTTRYRVPSYASAASGGDVDAAVFIYGDLVFDPCFGAKGNRAAAKGYNMCQI
jgi:hypothetical protein